jgi:hypothetical protein
MDGGFVDAPEIGQFFENGPKILASEVQNTA